ncbi:DsbA family protein [Chryseobacterium sp. MYb264]|uniref:DsbA family protein n=1 Tax=Chryseobacterium sp. MYb264 TaxID=2745153 RepID=UPI002E15C442|nr:DsbA family protein [Chryseobacterium sp. MYb264]
MTDKLKTTNPLLCDVETGMCEMPEVENAENIAIDIASEKVKIIYFTDPICSSCWGIEPQLRKLKLEYSKDVEIEYHMGGLLPDWSYNSGGISKPSDVAHHWDEVSEYYDMPIDGDVWLEDPLNSSYPSSIAFKAAQLQDKAKAMVFLRELRELLFLKKKNIAKWEYISEAAERANLNIDQLKNDFEGKAKQLFEEDLQLAREYGVRGFPTLFFVQNGEIKDKIYGTKPYDLYESTIKKIDNNLVKYEYPKSWESLFSKYKSLTAREFSELSGTERSESEKVLNELFSQGKLDKIKTKNGSLWFLK